MDPSQPLADSQSLDVEAVFDFCDDSAKESAFEHYWTKLEAVSQRRINLSILKICVQLLPPFEVTERSFTQLERLQRFLIDRIPMEVDDEERLYSLAEVSLHNPQLCYRLFSHMHSFIESVQDPVSKENSEQHTSQGVILAREEHRHTVRTYLAFIKCSYWLPPGRLHCISYPLLSSFLDLIGLDGLDDAVHDVLSALLQLLSKPHVGVLNSNMGQALHKSVLKDHIFEGDDLFNRFQALPLKYFGANAGKTFRTWFRWISHAIANGIHFEAVYTPFYWSILRIGLLTGFADQRKYCLGILRQSLLIPRRNITTSNMILEVDEQTAYLSQYDKYTTLFEIIVLDRYPNQVQACLPELTRLLGPGSCISASWNTALLTAALNPAVQDGIRKLVGNWYLEYINVGKGSITEHATFLVEGLLPWATQGTLYTSSLVSSRSTTVCTHGEALAAAITTFLTAMPTDQDRQGFSAGVLRFILGTGGKMFSASVLYLLEGLLRGLTARPILLDAADVDLILRVSRLSALPEVAGDLCTAYCEQLIQLVDPRSQHEQLLLQYKILHSKANELGNDTQAQLDTSSIVSLFGLRGTSSSPLRDFLDQLESSQHRIIRDDTFVPVCNALVTFLDGNAQMSFPFSDLIQILEALWEEADRQDFPRSVVLSIPPLFFHVVVLRACKQQLSETTSSDSTDPLLSLLSKALVQLHQLMEGRSFLLPALARPLRRACLVEVECTDFLPVEDFVVRFVNNPPLPRKDFLFEIAAAQKLQEYIPNRDYPSYYGPREWHGYAAIIDLLSRFPGQQTAVAKRAMDRLLEPWRTQQAPIPIISKWKNVMQLQTMLLLTEICVDELDADQYLDSFMDALVLEPWPRYRFLLEWIIARIYYRFPKKTDRILTNLESLDDNSPVHIASLIKLAILAAPFLDSEDFALKMMIQLIPFSASPKIQIRHEAHWSFPKLFALAIERKWSSITDNPAFQALDKHVRSLDKFSAPPSTIRTLWLDAVKDYTLTDIFQGRYLSIETPELDRVAHEDFVALYSDDSASGLQVPPSRIPLGDPIPDAHLPEPMTKLTSQKTEKPNANEPSAKFFQTKAGFDLTSLLPSEGPPSAQNKRPASVVLIASLIDNPTNLGGLSRISESFGLEALYIDDLKKTAHKDFKATSVTSEKHFPIRELKVPAVPDFLVSMKRQGYEVVGIEQTDGSGMLGEEEGDKGVGTLPKKCVLVLGSERGGITSAVLAVVDRCVEIKTVGVTRSLNVQTAGGIAVYEWWREWGQKT